MTSTIRLLALTLAVWVAQPWSAHAVEEHYWSKRLGGSGADVGYDIATGGLGEGYVATGSFANTVDFGGGPLISAGGSDAYLVKFDYLGAYQWSLRLGGSSNDVAYAVQVDPSSDQVTVVGSFEGTANFGGADLTSAGGTDLFVARYSGAGAHIWSKRFGGPLDDSCLDVVVQGGVLCVVGLFRDDIDFGGGPLTSAGGSDIFVARLDATGAHVWSHGYGGSLDDAANSICTTSSGNTVIVVGSFEGTVDFGGGGLTSAGGSDVFYAQFGSDGVYQGSARFGSTQDDDGNAVAVYGTQFWLTGDFRGTVNFGGGAVTSAGGSDIFVASYNATGVHQWSKRLGGPTDDSGHGIDVGYGGVVAVTGEFRGTANLGGGPRISAGGTDIFLATFETSTGFHRFSERYGDVSDDAGWAVAFHESGIPEEVADPVMTGSFRGGVDFGGGTLTSDGDSDAFVVDFRDTWAITDVGDTRQRTVDVSCFPNPFNPRTTVTYTVPNDGPVTVAVFDAKGAHVATLANREYHRAGDYCAEWDGRSERNQPAASGVYFVRVEQLGESRTSKMVLLK